ncbi:hypothetical protein [Streptomyces sp. Qhu_M48]|uniref:hypothetical protein n=1 Tax=Streptomyces sp. Qhu_M48 TaxID=3435889 RepID=UPI003F504F17
MIAADRPSDIPRWVGAHTRVHRQLTSEGVSPLLLTITLPRIRGALYGLWLLLTRRTT